MTTLNRTLLFITLTLLQVLVFNHTHIMGYATPMPFIYLILSLHSTTSRATYIILGFAIGLIVDIFSNTIGECAAATTLLALVAPNLLNAFSPADRDDDGFAPSPRTMKWSGYIKYALSATAVYCIAFFALDCFAIAHTAQMAIHIASSTVITLLVICAIEHIHLSIRR